ncbi:MAG: hypothetical protein R3F38_13175 [Gammaproteobacteria bacterium]
MQDNLQLYPQDQATGLPLAICAALSACKSLWRRLSLPLLPALR